MCWCVMYNETVVKRITYSARCVEYTRYFQEVLSEPKVRHGSVDQQCDYELVTCLDISDHSVNNPT